MLASDKNLERKVKLLPEREKKKEEKRKKPLYQEAKTESIHII